MRFSTGVIGAVSGLALLMSACAEREQIKAADTAETDSAAVRASIEAVNQLWAKAYVDGTLAEAAPRVFAPDAIRLGSGRDPVVGLDSIRSRLVGAEPVKAADYQMLEIGVSGDLAFTREAYAVTTMSGETFAGRSLVIWKRQADDSWKIHRIMFQ